MKKNINRIKKWQEELNDETRNLSGVQGHQSIYSLSARIGKHYCPYCYELLQVVKKSQIVNSESEEAKDFDFSGSNSGDISGGRLRGNIKFTWDVYYCAKCNIEISIKDMRYYEHEQKRIKK